MPYAVALAAVLLAVAVRWALRPLLAGHAPLLLFTLSVMVAARFGGIAPGLFATALSAAIGTFFFIEPYRTSYIGSASDFAYLGLFIGVGVAISLLNGQLRRALRHSIEAGARYHTLSARLAKIFATAPGVICAFRTRPDGSVCFPYASPRIREIYGLDPQDLTEDATPVFNRIHEDDVGHVRATIAESARTMTPWRDQFRVLNPSRGPIWVEGFSQPAAQPDGSVEWYGFVADITERHRMEQTLRDRTARLEELTRTLDLAHAIVHAPDGTITYWSQGAAAMYGWTPEEALGRCAHELLRTEFPASLADARAALLAAGHWEGELRHYRRDGTPVIVASHWALHADADGIPRSVMEVNNDISEQKRVERELRTSEERLELAQAAAGIAAWDWDIQANATHCSASYGPLYGLPRGHYGPSSEEWLELIHSEDRERLREELRLAVAGLQPYDTEFRVVAPHGTIRWVMGKGQVYRDGSGRATRMLGVNMDITDRKAAAEQLRALSTSLITAQEEERRRISRELHDDLTQRLCAMAIDLGRLADQPPQGRTLRSELRLLQERSVQAAELTRHIAHELHPAILDELGIETALRSYCHEVAEREEIEIAFASRDLPPAIRREAASCLYAVAQEGLVNVAKHARARHVRVELDGTVNSLRLLVIDDGVGFAAGSTATFGLGLVNLRERIRSMKGRFSVESQPGGGTRIAAEVPV